MLDYNKADFCEVAQGVKYIFAKMSIIYGSKFNSHWEGIDQQSINATWADILGVYATYRPSMDFALKHMDKNFIPSALAVFDLCKQAGRIPDKPHSLIEKQATTSELVQTQIAKDEALRKIRAFTRSITH
jgi:hypothetical protein